MTAVDEVLQKLLWALPLVLLIGLAAVLLLRKLHGAGPYQSKLQTLRLEQSLTVSERTQVHLLNVQGRSILLVEQGERHSVLPLTVDDPVSPWWRWPRRVA